MLGSGVLDTAIGLIFVFLLVSMLVTIVNEMISAMFLSRAKWLRKGIDRLLDSEWAQKLYEHPLIEGSATVAGSNPPGPWTVRGSGPSYIPSRSFANVLLDVVRRGDSTLEEAKRKLQAALDAVSSGGGSPEALMQAVIAAAGQVRPSAGVVTTLAADLKRQLDGLSAGTLDPGKWVADLEDKASTVSDPGLQSLKARLLDLARQCKEGPPGEEVRKGIQEVIDSIPYVAVAEAIKKDLSAMLERMKAGYTVGDARADVQRFIDGMPARYLREVIERFPSERIRKTLLVLLDDAEDDVDKFKQNIEVWFNNAMDRVGGWYKRRSQWVIAGLSLFAAVCVNVDTILVVKHLETHPGVRDALVARAKAYADATPPRASNPAGDVKVTPAGAAEDGARVHVDPALGTEFNDIQARLMQLNLPVGWVRAAPTPSSERANRQVLPQDASTLCDTVTFHLLGWLLTALAATLGAPFWFDTLNRFISIRSAGKAPEEKPKPPKDVPTPLEPGQSPREADAVNAPRKS